MLPITWHGLCKYCLNLSTSIFSYLLVFVAIKSQDCASSCSICSRLITRLVNLSILLSWILIISRRSWTFGLDEEVVLAYGVVTGVSDSMVAGVDEVDFDVKGRVDLFLVFILLLLLFLTILVSVLVVTYLLQGLQLEFFQLVSSRHLIQATILL